MYVRINKTPNSPRKSIQIVEGTRDKKTGQVKQKIIRYVGIAMDEREEAKLIDLAREIIPKLLLERAAQSEQQSLLPLTEGDFGSRKAGRRKQKSLSEILPADQVVLTDVEEESRIIEGVHEVAGHVFDDLYGKLCRHRGLSARAYDRLKDVVLARLVDPCSKYATQQKLLKNFEKAHDLDSLYRMMDKVFEEIPRIKTLTFQKTQSLFPKGIDLLLFDVTTLYFESIEVDEVRAFGYSKDHRFNTTQVVLALATNSDGLPIGYELFEGNKAEVKTLVAAIESWKKLFDIAGVCFVGDRAMMSEANVTLLETMKYQYIIAAKLKGLPEVLKSKILDEGHYQAALFENELSWIGEFDYNSQRLIVSYKSKRAMKDQKDRQVVIDKINKQLSKSGQLKTSKLISNKGIKKYVSLHQEGLVALDENKVEREAQWDGLHGIITNIKDEEAPALLSRYGRLWKIEESFRINKHTLKMRPIFHWKPERIHAHIALCYMAFSVIRHLEYQVNLTQKITVNTILDELLHVQASIHVHKRTKDRYRLPGSFSNNARKIYKAFNLTRNMDAAPYLN